MTEFLPKLLPALAILGSCLALGAVFPVVSSLRKKLVQAAVFVGWAGILGGAAGIYTAQLGSWSALVGTAACAGLAVLPMNIRLGSARNLAAASGALIPLAVAVLGLALSVDIAGEPSDTMLLYAGRWGIFCAALVSALVAVALGLVGQWKGGPDRTEGTQIRQNSRPSIRLYARDFALRAVILGWLSWLVAILIHWRQFGALGMASPAEWSALGAMMLASGALLMSWSTRRPRFEFIFVIYILWIAVHVGFS
jgi:hypothetical protein